MHKSLQNQLLRAIAAGFALGGCRSGSGDESARPAASPLVPSEAPAPPPTAAAVPSETTEPADAAAVEEPVHSASTSAECAAPAKRTQICYGKRTAPPRQVPYTPSFDADGCVAQREVVNHCNGIQAVYDGPKIQGGKCCYEVCKSPQIPPCGRALLDDDGHARVAAVRDGVGWSAPIVADLPTAARDFWRDNGRLEHASVAAFAQLTVSLMAVGAPPKLIRDAQQDSIDEIEHTQICFAVARAIDGQAIAPAAFPEARAQKRLFTGSRRLALAQIALDALADGVLNEGVAARLLAELAQRCELEEVKPWLTKMAADESRHAAHSWEIVEFCLEQGGLTVAAALRSACTRLPERLPSTLPADAHDGAWSTWGVHSLAMEEAAFAKTRRNVERKLNALLARHAAAQRERGIAA